MSTTAAECTGDAVLYDVDGTVHEDGDAIRDAIQEFDSFGPSEVALAVIEIEVFDDTAYVIGRWTTILLEADFDMEGYFMSVFTRDNGEWRVRRDINNLVMPEEGVGSGWD